MKTTPKSPIWIVLLCVLASPAALAQTREETSLWDAVKDSKDSEDYKAYLDRYPDGVYATLAKRRAAEFDTRTAKARVSASTEPKIDSRVAPEKLQPRGATSVTLTECEAGACSTWKFLGSQGNGQWPSGVAANLSVQQFDRDSVSIRRTDTTGPSAGLTAIYRGTRHGDRVVGSYTATVPGRSGSVTGDWQATIEKAPVNVPTLMHVCIRCDSGTGATLVWADGHYRNAAALPGESENFAVESFTPESIILHRTDSGLHVGEAILTGRISPQGNSIVDGIQRWIGDSKHDHEFQAAWGDAISSVPGSKQADPPAIARPLQCFPWFSTMFCQLTDG